MTYRFTFTRVNEDPTTFFNIRLGKGKPENHLHLRTQLWTAAKTFQTIVANGVVPPNNIGPRSIESGVGLGAPDYASLMTDAITNASTGETVFCGPVDDPFFVDLGGVFDLGNLPRQNGSPRDGLGQFNATPLSFKCPSLRC